MDLDGMVWHGTYLPTRQSEIPYPTTPVQGRTSKRKVDTSAQRIAAARRYIYIYALHCRQQQTYIYTYEPQVSGHSRTHHEMHGQWKMANVDE